MSTKLTVKEEKACQHYALHGNKSDAYRHAFDTSSMLPATVNNKAYQLFKRDDIRARIDELLGEALKRTEITQDTIAAMLMEDRKLAQDTEKASAAVSATMGLAKLYGLLTDKVEGSAAVTVNIVNGLGDD